MLSLAGEWFQCTVQCMKRVDGPLYVSDAAQPMVDGMSGSPILSDDGDAIGIECLGSSLFGSKNPRLVRDLPGWLHEQQRKVKYSCPECGLNAWAKPDVCLVCGECHQPMEAE
jgi:hypothetical protein